MVLDLENLILDFLIVTVLLITGKLNVTSIHGDALLLPDNKLLGALHRDLFNQDIGRLDALDFTRRAAPGPDLLMILVVQIYQ